MLKEEFIDFLLKIGFTRNWQTMDSYSINTDTDHNVHSESMDSIVVTIEENKLNLSTRNISLNGMKGKHLAQYDLEKFDEKSKMKFLIKIARSFEEIPESLKPYLRDIKLKKILDDYEGI